MKFDYCKRIDAVPQCCTIEEFKHTVNAPYVAELIEKYRAGDASAKRSLPAFCFHASFGGKKRASAHAVASGLVMIDFDHLTDDELLRLSSALKDGGSEEWGVRLVHITPSGKGLRVVIKAMANDTYDGCDSIKDFQERFASLVGMSDRLDGVTTDLARLSFAPCARDIIYMSSAMFGEQPDFTAFKTPEAPQAQAPIATADTGQMTYEGIALADIFEMYFTITGGLPQEGGRNAAFYTAARDLRYICDFNPNVLARFMPNVGLPESEVKQVCASACLSSRASKIPATVQDAINALRETSDDDTTADEPETGDARTLPAIVRPIVGIAPAGFEEATVLALLPILGTLATGVRARYLDGELHSPSFSTIITAEQASGKSFTRTIVDQLLKTIKDEDTAARVVEQAYKVDLRKKKNSKEQPEDPRVVIRLVPASISVAKLLQRLDYADGKHLFSFAEELDTVIKSNQSGAWSQKSDIYRNAFDNAEYGQDFMSDNSYSANLKVFYNLLMLGTPRQTMKFYKDVENGLVSRTCFAHLPDGFGQRMPVMKKLSDQDAAKIEKQVGVLRAVNCEVEMRFLFPAIEEWLEKQRLIAIKESNRARDIFRKRSAVIGFRAAMMLRPLYANSGKNLERLKEFALYVADVVLKNQLAFAGERLNEVLNASSTATKRTDVIFDLLGDEFTTNDVIALSKKSNIKTPHKGLIYLWRKNGLIEKVSQNNYKKIKTNGNQLEKVQNN